MMRALLRLLFGLVCLLGLGGCGDSKGYHQKGGRWHFGDTAFDPQDAATFKPLGPVFGRDAQRGYYRGAPVPGSEGASFEVLGEHEARDRRAVYYADTYRKAQEYWLIQHLRIEEVPGADPASYRPLAHAYARDRAGVFHEGRPIRVRDPASFEPLTASFARDARRGYYENREIPDSDGASFAMVNDRDLNHARDRHRVYHGRIALDASDRGPGPVVQVLKGADPDSFKALGADYGADARRVYHRGRLLEGADPGSFEVLASSTEQADARDRSGSFLRGIRQAAGGGGS